MKAFLLHQLGADPGTDVIDLCLDHALIRGQQAHKFTHIAGLDLFPNLETLSISMQEIGKAEGMEGLHALRDLNLSLNHISEVSGLAGLPLEKLDLSHNEILSLKGLPVLPVLQELNLGHNQLREMWEGPQLPVLRTLTLSGNRQIKAIRNLGTLPALRALYLKGCYISQWEGLSAAQQLEMLSISPGSMQGLQILQELPRLKSLIISAKRLHGTATLPPHSGLKSLQIIGGQALETLQGLQALPALETLILRQNRLKSAPNLSQCVRIRHLDLSYNPLSALPDLSQLSQLETLILDGSPIHPKAILDVQAAFPKVDIRF
ncbi:MAG TPA: hypothetical protein ENJ82_14330 [Bacteroidetes bacterium]|nr:hypothetical protein [Bacteroidota bacterium]